MNRRIKIKSSLVAAALLLVLGVAGGVVGSRSLALAHEGEEHPPALPGSPALEKRKAEKQEAAERVKTLRDQLDDRKAKLDSAKLRICQAREKNINTLRSGMSNRRDNNLRMLSQLSERIQNFYEDKNLSVANYDALVAAVNDKKAAAEAALAALKAAAPQFKCDGSDPKGDGSIFKSEHQKAVGALKEYKTAVKNLFVAVKEAAKAAEGSN